MTDLKEITERIIAGGNITREEAAELAATADLNQLCDAADAITRALQPKRIDSCSIVNARSGLCSEDCKWCAQSARYSTGCSHYPWLPYERVLEAARHNEREGIRRFSLVTSGKNVGPKDMEVFCEQFRHLSEDTGLYLCASMGLIGREEMQRLADAGVKRYHCNMETSEKVFRTLCSTHTPADKRRTIAYAREAGMEICSGGIIGMGETMADRIDFAFELADINPDSVPINILNPIPGTPLQDTPLISEEEIIRTAALFRFILPRQSIRFAGGRMRLSEESMARMLRGGVNGVLMGDMLTTVSHMIADDRRLFARTGWEY
ncbi:MAG: biotin synthase BioB [Muribaculaceae bacterium]|nr:biotin synthase BioB [Muribaculaceae bacterium]